MTRTLPRFQTLQNNYPNRIDPCDQGRQFDWNQCAIRLSIALVGAGFRLTNYDYGPTCRHGHARGAQALADYIWREVHRPEIYDSAAAARQGVAQREGVIHFRDISGFRGGRGDHIDLWTGTRTMTGAYFDRADRTMFWEIS